MELKADVTHKSGDQYAVSLSTNVPMVDNQPAAVVASPVMSPLKTKGGIQNPERRF
ncbi:hypothetical protein HGG75_20815 [Ochrobactrum pseudogrignonense]|nr:hypothetical protein [Brucella pseudogrignonensis]